MSISDNLEKNPLKGLLESTAYESKVSLHESMEKFWKEQE